ncbi:hypothetical protein AAVH_03169 [Aphelenchoides avenae]|nr:hypothetical protein AAVH_03169 [Aphelenchus avenae]
MPEKDTKGCCGVPAFAVLILAAVSALFALLLANYLYIGWGCNRSKALFDTEVRWDGSERISIAEKNVTVIRALSKERCYVLRNNLPNKAGNEVSVIRKLDETELHALAGDDAVLFCKGEDTYLLSTASG